jgi:hypothetical protein
MPLNEEIPLSWIDIATNLAVDIDLNETQGYINNNTDRSLSLFLESNIENCKSDFRLDKKISPKFPKRLNIDNLVCLQTASSHKFQPSFNRSIYCKIDLQSPSQEDYLRVLNQDSTDITLLDNHPVIYFFKDSYQNKSFPYGIGNIISNYFLITRNFF